MKGVKGTTAGDTLPARIKRRARIAAIVSQIAESDAPEWEEIAAWVEGCAHGGELRMLCIELVATHQRTGAMTSQVVLRLAQRLEKFAILPENPAKPVPVPRGEAPPVEAARQTA